MRSSLLFICVITFSLNAYSQKLGDFKPKEQSYGLKKIKDKRLYVASFTVNYQVYNEKQEFKQGGRMLGGARKGDAEAALSVGLEGLTETNLQNITNRLYEDFTGMLKNNGITIIAADEAGKTDAYSGFTKVTGGTINRAQFPGTLASTPAGMEYYIKKVDRSGKEKSGGFMNQAAFVHAKLSRDLADAIIADVDLFILFIEDKGSWDIAGANIKVKTNMRLAAQEAIEMSKNTGFRMKGQNTYTGVNSQVGFYSGKIGAGIVSSYVGTLGRSMKIEEVLEDKKIQAFSKSHVDYVGVETAYGKYYNPYNSVSTSTTIIPVDEKRYTEGVYMAGKKFIEYHTAEFLKAL